MSAPALPVNTRRVPRIQTLSSWPLHANPRRDGVRAIGSSALVGAKTPTGTIFSFSLSEQTTVTFSFAQSVGRRKVGGECVTQTEKNRRKPACMRTAMVGRLTFTGHSGTNKVGRSRAASRP